MWRISGVIDDANDYICITDIANAKNSNSRAADVVRNWLRNRATLEFLATWEGIIRILKCSNLNTLKNRQDC